MKTFNFKGWWPQKTKPQKSIFSHNSKSICYRKTCNTSLDSYFKFLCFRKSMNYKFINRGSFWGAFRFFGGLRSPKNFFINFFSQKVRNFKYASNEVLHVFLQQILFELWLKIDFGGLVFWGHHPWKLKFLKKIFC